MLDCGGEERGAVDLLPEIESGVVPAVGDVVEIEQEDGPEHVADVSRVRVGDEPVGIRNERRRAESRTVTLRATPSYQMNQTPYL